jgi:nucleotide-binding universal stress UspA family protein
MSAHAAAAIPAARFRNILLPTDFSDCARQAIPYATGIARKYESKLHLCHIVTPAPFVIGAPEAAPAMYESRAENSRKELENLLCAEEREGIATDNVVATGSLNETIRRIIQEREIELVIAGTHGRTGIRRLFLGSVAEEICRVVTCPVMTIGPWFLPRREMRIRRILFPTDLSDESTSVISSMVSLAACYNASITVLHVISLEDGIAPDTRLLADPMRDTLDHLFRRDFGYFNPEFRVEFGEPGTTILRVARELNADLIVMGIMNAFAHSSRLHSSVAYRVIAGAYCPVLTCR